jgi:hypothetical protein
LLDGQTFRLAPMCRRILVLTVGLLLLPAGLLVGMVLAPGALLAPTVLLGLIYVWVWLRFRPKAFVIHSDRLEVVWPLKRRQIPRAGIQDVRLITAADLKREVGLGVRVGAGGLWGGFGWLWTQRRGIVQMYISRTSDLVWIERGAERPWLITPERLEAFVHQLSSFAGESGGGLGVPQAVAAVGASPPPQGRG